MKEINLQMSEIDPDLSVDQNLQKMVIEMAQYGFTVEASDLDSMKQVIADVMSGDEFSFPRGDV